MAESFNVIRYLKENAAKDPSKPALIMSNESISFGELWDNVCRISEGLLCKGMAPGDRLIIMIPMSIDLYSVLLGSLKAGCTAVFVDPWVGMKQIASFSAFAEPRGFAGIPKSHLLRLFSADLRKLPVTITTGFKIGSFPAKFTLKELLKYEADEKIYEANETDTALITFTTGSSGIPKGANRTHGFLNAQHLALKNEFPYEESDVDMPMFPVFALNNLATGLTSVIPDMDFKKPAEVDGEKIYHQIMQYGVTTITSSPPFIDRLAEYCMGKNIKPDVRRIMTGGAPVSNRQLKKWKLLFNKTDIEVVYGSTEAEPVAHIKSEERVEAQETSNEAMGYCMGKPSELVSCKIIPITKGLIEKPLNEIEISDQTPGELIVSGKHICRDYYKNEAAVKENKIKDDNGTIWHRMGDTGYFDTKGRFWLVGRVHSTIIRNGKFVHPQVIEEVVKSYHDTIIQAAVAGFPDSQKGEKAVIFIQTLNNSLKEEDILEHLKSFDLRADQVIITSKPLPVDPRHNSKIDYPKLKAQFKSEAK